MNTFDYLKPQNNIEKLKQVKAYLIDMDGTTYLGADVLPGVTQFVEILKNKRLKFMFFTNNPSQDTASYADKLNTLGIDVSPDDILSSTIVTGLYLKE